MKKRLTLPLVAAMALSGCDKLPEIPEAWKPIPVNGKYFYNANLGPRDYMWQLWDNYKDDPMFENMWLEIPGPLYINDVKGIEKDGTFAFVPETRYKGEYPVKITEMLKSWGSRGEPVVERFKTRCPNGPIAFALWGSRPIWWMKDTFDVDKEDFKKWREEHPGFIGFVAYDEYDSDIGGFDWKRERFTNAVDRARLDAEYVETGSNEDIRHWTDRNHEKTKAFHFGTDALQGLWSVGLSTGHDIARKGVNCLWCEAEMGSTCAPWRWSGMYARGASRQFHTPFAWYTAAFTFNTCLRNGQKTKDVKDGVSCTHWPNVFNRTWKKYMGAGRSLMKRNEAYGYFIGAVAELQEGANEFLTAYTEEEPNKVILSPYGEDIRDVFAWNKKHERGIPYTPIAMLVSLDEPMDRQSYNVQRNHDRFSQTAFLTTLVCPRMENVATCADEKKGLQGCMFNSEFGEIMDVLCTDTGQKTEDFHKALSAYTCAILVGWFNPKYFDKDAIVRYVKEGGIVYAERKQVAAGLIPESVPGAKGRIELVDNFVCDAIRNSKDDWWTVRTKKMFSGEVENPVIRDLLRKLQDEYLPVKVEGDIQWGCNLTGKGWMVWLMNNKGVAKFLEEPEDLDPKATAHVKVTYKPTGKVYEADVGPGDWSTIEIKVKD